MPEETNSPITPPADALPPSVPDAPAGALPAESILVQPASAEPVSSEPMPVIPEPLQPEVQPQTVNESPSPNLSPQGRGREEGVATGLSHLFAKLKEKLGLRTQKRLDKIMDYARKKGSVTNDEAEKLLHVSDATATRYLSNLVKQGKLKPAGKTKDIKYSPL